jgi:hypothetical protein
MATAIATKTGWVIRKAKTSIVGGPATEKDYYPVYIFADGDERNFAEHHTSAADCREMIRNHFDNGRKAPARHTRLTAAEIQETLWRVCLSDPC